jgi:hypothetical protein
MLEKAGDRGLSLAPSAARSEKMESFADDEVRMSWHKGKHRRSVRLNTRHGDPAWKRT